MSVKNENKTSFADSEVKTKMFQIKFVNNDPTLALLQRAGSALIILLRALYNTQTPFEQELRLLYQITKYKLSLQDTYVFSHLFPCILDDTVQPFLVPFALEKHRCRRPGLGYDIKENRSIN